MKHKFLGKVKKTVLVGMSGGVDSSVTAALLKRQGYDVIGVFLRFWKEKNESSKNEEALRDVKKVAKILEIPIRVIDARKKFRHGVVDYFLDSYKKGLTPNPCVFCNENLKFEILFCEMEKLGGNFIATGHYARAIKSGKRYRLFKAKDKNKDQSYFLYRLNQKRLSKLIFPLGEYKKAEVRKVAQSLKLPVFAKKESQNVCFLLDDNTDRFLKDFLKLKSGNIEDPQGNILGRHQGLPLYTIGQRKGINIGGTGPYYVFAKDRKRNILKVTNDSNDPRLHSLKIKLKKVTWVTSKPLSSIEVFVKTRYQQKSVYAIISRHKGSYLVSFKKPLKAVAPGQSTVFYSAQGEILGGGIIDQ